ncbi:MAG: glycosyltransferase [Chitinophagales bacterium]|nr:glycosyltransferase [Chitinophagales bacterium]
MKLTIILVSYNVKYFLEQALASVRKAVGNLSVETIVVDNASNDGSVALVKSRFPEVILIENKDNKGFAVANNQAIKIALGEYVLLLNPDTLVQEDTLEKTVQFMEAHPEAGGLGVKMVDGKGIFLPESKRGLPTPKVAFFKLFGLSALFPKSKTFGQYHLGFLDENKTHEVDVLSGAFMLMRKKVLDEIGLLDETFFMYGEDIDLSYRITKAGYKNYYFPETRIIHYKGESTKKGSLNYVRMFYNAMVIFARKHFDSQLMFGYSFLVTVAVYLTAMSSFFKRVLQKLLLPLADAGLLFVGMYVIRNFYATNFKGAPEYYPIAYMLYIVPAYIFLWLVSVYLSGGYDKPLKNYRVVRGLLIGTLLIAAFYAFLPDTLRFSRAMILLGAGWAVFAMVALRLVLVSLFGKKFDLGESNSHRMLIVGSKEESERALTLLSHADSDYSYIGYVSDSISSAENYLGSINELQNIREIYKADEIIFCSKDISAKQIIDSMVVNGPELNYKIVPEDSMSVIGSNSKNTSGDLYAIDVNLAITSAMNRRNKRLFDLVVCVVLLFTFPVKIFLVKNFGGLIKNWCSVLLGGKSWVGYAKSIAGNGNYVLPKIKEGVLSPVNALKDKTVNDVTRARLNLFYAKEYSVYSDMNILLKGVRDSGMTTN